MQSLMQILRLPLIKYSEDKITKCVVLQLLSGWTLSIVTVYSKPPSPPIHLLPLPTLKQLNGTLNNLHFIFKVCFTPAVFVNL